MSATKSLKYRRVAQLPLQTELGSSTNILDTIRETHLKQAPNFPKEFHQRHHKMHVGSPHEPRSHRRGCRSRWAAQLTRGGNVFGVDGHAEVRNVPDAFRPRTS